MSKSSEASTVQNIVISVVHNCLANLTGAYLTGAYLAIEWDNIRYIAREREFRYHARELRNAKMSGVQISIRQQ